MHQGRITQRPYQSADGSPAQGGSSGKIQTGRKRPLTRQLHGSRFCNGQSTQEPLGSTGLGEETVSYSIETTYSHSASTDFHKRCDLFWDKWSHLHNLHQLNGLQKRPRVILSTPEISLELRWRSPEFTLGCFPGQVSGNSDWIFCRRNRSQQQLAVSFRKFRALF
jgi:hypothetical protein